MSFTITSQDIELFEQFNGRFDYTAIGNTLNPAENNLDSSFCEILPSSQATLNLNANQTVIKAYLYWAGSGEGDTNVSLNAQSIDAEITYNVEFGDDSGLVYFSCFTDVTNLILEQGNGDFTFADLDISETLNNNLAYCNNRTNFAGWSIYIIYEDLSLPINQISIFQGLDIINSTINETTIELSNLNVIDTQGAKIGFLAWEGDNSLNFGESLSINGNILSNPPLNLADNAFNGTNTFTNSNTFYNVDLDVYDVQDNIAIGDTSATIQLTTGDFDDNGQFRADLIIINNIITVLNSQLPDATIALDSIITNCGNSEIDLEFTIYNLNSTDTLPSQTPVAFYIDSALIGTFLTENDIAINGSETYTITLQIPEGSSNTNTIVAIVDDQGDGTGVVAELNETNNADTLDYELLPLVEPIPIGALTNCNEGFFKASFNLNDILSEIINPENDTYHFFETLEDLLVDTNEIINTDNYTNTQEPQKIYIKNNNEPCFDIYSFQLEIENCPPIIPQGFSPNDDGKNDWFNIQGLYNIYLNHELHIYNRYGTLIFKGNNDARWFGLINKGFPKTNEIAPVGTYYYLLKLNEDGLKDKVGWVYLNR